MNAMKIGFVVDKITFGGGERILKMLIDGFSNMGHEIVIYTWNSDWSQVKCDYNVNLLRFPPIGLAGKFKSFSSLYGSLKKTKPNCLIVFSLGLAEVAVWSALLAKVPIILSERVDPHYLPKSKLHRFLKIITYRLSNGIVFQTEDVLNFFPKSIRNKGVIIQNPIMDDNLPLRAKSLARKEIVAIGRLSEEKNFDMLIAAFSELHLLDYKLRIFGDGPMRKYMDDLITALGLKDRVILEGNVDRVVDYIKDSDILVLTSNHEGMPNALIEGLAMGLACISTDFPSGGARALIHNNENGILIPVGDKLALKNALLKLIEDNCFKSEIKTNALNIRDTNSKSIILSQWIDFIQSIVKE